ncbi:peptidylprolyl isomerase [Corynebacterium pseudodiphtheriticum]|uniref:peptidylprolyl isomerase n=1 Tax=Corynebacterium pseudodiphtheriticum TaxID=37637 RepID=UPI000F86CDFE|nr:peptidylprolyl isomerase [Corynebacterium pseudodiphtheriticum]MCG7252115.1 peptidylprolyl isomerase [Corynebacterium pseudodiphtheriticum]MDC7110104.1 peptidylprolyl isomerase [Corynebacterium pseudodiphtheriticum]MDC7113881.1 peptidylprolyl isomerase [Corynebacterium pseudodiphtheriticum]MDK4243147.1 peptidylprolyl isomerase [Corynebacterium pseudodiphtheriticum]MDK4277519.1 peptidylprolyl isomerase [Corynebacterium pseudodiphtheriticum]
MEKKQQNNQQRGAESLDELDKALKSRERKEKSRPLGIAAIAALAIVVLVGGIWLLATRDGDEADLTAEEENTTPEAPDVEPLALERSEKLPQTVTCTYEKRDAENGASDVGIPETDEVSARGHVNVTLETSQGEIGMELDREVAPCTVNAIEHLTSAGYYDDTVCHRLTTSGIHVLQCGDPTGQGSGGPGFQFANEYPTDELGDEAASTQVVYPRGSIAMANAGAGTNGSQFFLNYKDSPLQANYTYFGQINDEGLKTLDAIAQAGTEDGSGDGTPSEEVRIKKAVVQES